LVEPVIADFMEKLVLPDEWQTALQQVISARKNEIDPTKEKARLKAEMRRAREAFNRGTYEGEEYLFWREFDTLKEKLNALEMLTPIETRQASNLMANLHTAWLAATPDEKAELCKIVLQKVVYDFGSGEIIRIVPKPEYEALFEIMK